MPYDPTLPANNSPIIAAELRDQFQGLKDNIDNKVDGATLDITITPLTAGNCEGVVLLPTTVSNPPNQSQVQAIVAKLNELIAVLQRP